MLRLGPAGGYWTAAARPGIGSCSRSDMPNSSPAARFAWPTPTRLIRAKAARRGGLRVVQGPGRRVVPGHERHLLPVA